MQKIIQSPIHVVATMRSKTEYVLEENDKGKKVPRKVGLAPQVRSGAEYEFDVVLECDHENNVWATKSRCPALNGKTWIKPKTEIADVLKAWLSDGAPAPVAAPVTSEPTAADLGAAFHSTTSRGFSRQQVLQTAADVCGTPVNGANDIPVGKYVMVMAAWAGMRHDPA